MDQIVTGFVWLTLSSIYKQSIFCTLKTPTAQALAMVLNDFIREIPGKYREIYYRPLLLNP
jgi:hypothetical protein